jgi:hypothetical protein
MVASEEYVEFMIQHDMIEVINYLISTGIQFNKLITYKSSISIELFKIVTELGGDWTFKKIDYNYTHHGNRFYIETFIEHIVKHNIHITPVCLVRFLNTKPSYEHNKIRSILEHNKIRSILENNIIE